MNKRHERPLGDPEIAAEMRKWKLQQRMLDEDWLTAAIDAYQIMQPHLTRKMARWLLERAGMED